MNPEHYEKLQRVLRQSRAEMGPLYAQFEAIEKRSPSGTSSIFAATLTSSAVCEKFWNDEFPKEQGYGSTVTLDLQGADLTGGVFTGMFLDRQLNGANFRHACLDDTLWCVTAAGADFTEASLRASQIVSAKFSKCTFRHAHLHGSSIIALRCNDGEQSDFGEADLSDASIELFDDPIAMILTGASLTGCGISTASRMSRSKRKRALDAFLDSLSEQQRSEIVLDDDHRKLRESAHKKWWQFWK